MHRHHYTFMRCYMHSPIAACTRAVDTSASHLLTLLWPAFVQHQRSGVHQDKHADQGLTVVSDCVRSLAGCTEKMLFLLRQAIEILLAGFAEVLREHQYLPTIYRSEGAQS